MKLALLGLLLTLAAPAPFCESAAGVEEEIVVESSRSSKAISPRAPSPKLAGRSVASFSPARTRDASLPHRAFAVWTPRLFSRPPPLG